MKEFIEQLNNKQKTIIDKLGSINDDFAGLEEKLSDYLQLKCMTDDGVTEEGMVVLSILDKLVEI